jgi:hypothetical protein
MISLLQRPLPDNTQHSQQTDIHRTPLDDWSVGSRDLYLTTHNTHNTQTSMSPGGFRTHNLSRRAAADARLRPRGHWDRPAGTLNITKWKSINLLIAITSWTVYSRLELVPLLQCYNSTWCGNRPYQKYINKVRHAAGHMKRSEVSGIVSKIVSVVYDRKNYMLTSLRRDWTKILANLTQNTSSSFWYMIWYMICYDMIWYIMIRYNIWHDMVWYMICYDMIWYTCMIRYNIWYDMIYVMLCYDLI